MLCKLICAELMKLRRSPVWLAFIVMPVIPALMGTFNYLENLELLHSEWYSLWTQHTLFTDYIFLPLLIGIYCSYTMYIEQKNHNWNRVLTAPAPKGTVFAAKLVCVGFLILLSELWIAVLYVVSGRIVGLSAAVPLGKLTVWCLFGTLGGLVMAAMQLTVSLFLRGFAMPVAIALAGGLSGLLFLAKHRGHIWPYSLMAYGMNSNAPQELMKSGYAGFIITCAVYLCVFTVIGSMILSRCDK